MTRLFRYVPIAMMPAALAAGWSPTFALAGTCHGDYAVLCEWLCACPEPWPLTSQAAE